MTKPHTKTVTAGELISAYLGCTVEGYGELRSFGVVCDSAYVEVEAGDRVYAMAYTYPLEIQC